MCKSPRERDQTGPGSAVITPGTAGEYISGVRSGNSLRTRTRGACAKMRIHDTDKREREWEMLQEATGEATTSGAIDVATNYYLQMHGDNAAAPTGAITELMQLAEDQGSVTPAEIAEVLDVEELSVDHEQNWSVGGE